MVRMLALALTALLDAAPSTPIIRPGHEAQALRLLGGDPLPGGFRLDQVRLEKDRLEAIYANGSQRIEVWLRHPSATGDGVVFAVTGKFQISWPAPPTAAARIRAWLGAPPRVPAALRPVEAALDARVRAREFSWTWDEWTATSAARTKATSRPTNAAARPEAGPDRLPALALDVAVGALAFALGLVWLRRVRPRLPTGVLGGWALAAASLLVTLLIAEGTLRFWRATPWGREQGFMAVMDVHPETVGKDLFWHMTPFDDPDGDGIRGRGWPSAQAGARTVLLLGDSIAHGVGLPEVETIAARLRPRWLALDASVQGYATAQERILLERLLPQIHPAAVVLLYSPDDMAEYVLRDGRIVDGRIQLRKDTPALVRILVGGRPHWQWLARSVLYRAMVQPWLTMGAETEQRPSSAEMERIVAQARPSSARTEDRPSRR